MDIGRGVDYMLALLTKIPTYLSIWKTEIISRQRWQTIVSPLQQNFP